MQYSCPRCGVVSDQRYCPRHRGKAGSSHWSPTRDRAKQAKFRRELIALHGERCSHRDRVSGERCEETTDLRACHVTPLRDGGTYDVANGELLCATHDRETDRYAR